LVEEMQISCRMLVCFVHGQANRVIFLVTRKYTVSSLPSLTFCCLSRLYFVADYISYSWVLINICNGRSGVDSRWRQELFFFLHHVQTGPGVHPASSTKRTGMISRSMMNIFMNIHGSTAVVGLGIFYEVPLSHSDTPYSARCRDAVTTHITQKRQTSMPPAGFEPAILARDRPQTHALVRPPGSAKYILLAESRMIQYTTKHLPLRLQPNRMQLCSGVLSHYIDTTLLIVTRNLNINPTD
jgi:hypothetical protein